jgi:hypothetical protein
MNRELLVEYYKTFKGPSELRKPTQIIVYRYLLLKISLSSQIFQNSQILHQIYVNLI